MRSPNNWDVSVYRNISFAEWLRVQLRFETYNTLNHTQFSHTQINPLFMQATSARPPRRAEIAVRVSF